MKINKQEIYIFGTVLIIWIITQFIYSSYLGSLGDQELYLSGSAPNNEGLGRFSNTKFTYYIYSLINLFLPGKLGAILPISFSAIFLFRSFKSIYFHLSKSEKFLLLLSIITPHFWIWQATASKEAIVIPFSLIILYYSAKATFFNLIFKEKFFATISFLLVSLIKIQLIPAYLVIFISINLRKIISYFRELRKYLFSSFSLYSFALTSIFSTIIYLCLFFFRENLILLINRIMILGKLHFLSSEDANTSRFDIEWSNVSDFFNNMSWGIPASFLGFLPNEIGENSTYFFFFLEGLYSTFIIILLNLLVFKLALNVPNIRFFYFFGIIPATILLVIIHYSMGIFNAGTAIRYKQNIIPIINYLPIYLIGFYRMYQQFKSNKSSKTFN